MPLAADAYAEIAPPMLTCVQKNSGYQYELMIRVSPNEPGITRVRLGPYRFQDRFRPRPMLGGLANTSGPENALWMHVASPPRWSRVRWEIAVDEADQPAYLAWTGNLPPGSIGIFRFISGYRPGGLRTGLTLYRGEQIEQIGVNGPNYERFEAHSH